MGLTMSGDFAKLKRDLAALGDFDCRGLNESIGEDMVSATIKRFENEESPDGTKWPRSIRAATEGGKTLSKIGRLKSSINPQASASQVEIGTNVKYAAVHQFGKTIKPKKAKALRFQVGGRWMSKKQVTIPARPFLGINDENVEEIEAEIIAHIKGRLK